MSSAEMGQPNNGMQVTAYSVLSNLAPGSGSSSPGAFGSLLVDSGISTASMNLSNAASEQTPVS